MEKIYQKGANVFMNHFLRLRRLLSVCVVSGILLPWIGCGGAGSPPASIPAPVSSLMTISAPDPTGAVTINGAAGSVQPGANVQAKNITQAGPFTRWENPFLRNAYAQTFEAQVTADDQGAFTNLRVDGATGDHIGIRQEVGGDFSPVTELIVP
jgi:hypothetical protein